MDDILVSINCITYNHEKYISQAIESFLMQKTNFNFEILIHDDASTDRTAEIIKEYQKKYPKIIKPILQKENQFKKGIKINYTFNYMRSKGKYIALCEGDDFWTDSLKLQKQADYMEKYPNCSMVFHAAEILTESGKKTGKIIRLFNKDTIWPENKLFYGSGKTNATASIMYRKKFMDNPPKWYFNTPVDDTPLALILSTKGTIAYIDEFMSVYRVGVLGSWNSQVHKNKEKMKMVLKKLIVMLDEFNKYSKYKYDEDIKYKKLELEIKLISFDSKINLISFMKHQKVILYLKKYSFLRKVKFVSKLYFPRVYEILSSYKFYINLYFNNFKCKLLKRKVK